MKRLFLLLAVLVAACQPVDALNLTTLADSGYTITEDVSYGASERNILDIYRPNEGASLPIVVFVHGGSWKYGDKSDYRFLGQALAEEGYITLVPNYALAPERFPQFAVDVARAIAWASENASRFGGDAARIYVIGHSAGAYNAAMALSYPSAKPALGGAKVKGVVGLAGPYDFLPLTDPDLIAIFGGENNQDTMPINHVAAGLPPMLLITGSHDDVVDPANTTRYADRLKSKGNKVETLYLEGVSHIGIIGGFSRLLRNDSVWNPVLAFLGRH